MPADVDPYAPPDLLDLPPALRPLARDPAIQAGLATLIERAFRAGRSGAPTDPIAALRRRPTQRRTYRVSVVPAWLEGRG